MVDQVQAAPVGLPETFPHNLQQILKECGYSGEPRARAWKRLRRILRELDERRFELLRDNIPKHSKPGTAEVPITLEQVRKIAEKMSPWCRDHLTEVSDLASRLIAHRSGIGIAFQIYKGGLRKWYDMPRAA